MAPQANFSLWFQGVLDRRGLSQADASKRLGIGTGRISEWVTGKSRPSAESCRRIARVFLLDEDEVLVAAGRRTPDPHYDPDSAEAKLLPVIRSITWTPAMIEGAAKFLTGIREMARELRGIEVAPSELGEVNATEAMREGPGDDVPGGGE